MPARLAFATFLAFAAATASAETFPDRPVSMIVPYAAGGSSDVLARLLGERLTQALGQPIVVDDRAGAGSRIGSELVAHAAPDGYTLLLADMPLTIIPAIQKGVRYDPARDFTPIGLIGTASMVLFVNPATPATTVAGFIALARKEPGKITIASGGIGSTTHLTAELFQAKAGVKLLHVPYRGAGPALTDLMAGQVRSGFTTLATAAPALAAGSVRALASASEKRIDALPDVPTFREAGIDLVVEHWWGVLAPAGLPPATAARLQAALRDTLAAPDIATRLAPLGVTPAHRSPDELHTLIANDTARWADIVRAAGITPQ
jgi:tripartite-type tricarboxylate transporter receptor subunit TctC